MNSTFQGRLIQEQKGKPLAALRIDAWDKDPSADDYLGSAISGPDGEFTITFDESMFADLGAERYPDVYFKVFRCDDLLLSTKNSLLWNVNTPKSNVRIEIPIKPLAAGWVERHIYLKIERIEKYSPVRPQEKVVPPVQYGRDCMRNEGHENALIPEAEIQARSLTAVV